MKRNRVLLLMTSHFSLHSMFIENLEKMGYEVTFIDSPTFHYKNIFQRLDNFYHKTFLGDRDYKQKLRESAAENSILEHLKTFQKDYFEFSLVIRPDLFSLKIVSRINQISKKSIAYQWDGMKRFEISDEVITAYDTFALFDRDDYEDYHPRFSNIILTNNPYFDVLQPAIKKEIDLLYVGTLQHERMIQLKYLSNISENLHLKTYFQLLCLNKKTISDNPNIKICYEYADYREVAEISKNSKIVLDLKYPKHNGLSLRILEALHFNQKIISDNFTIKDYDFYNENNFLIVESIMDLTEETLREFVNQPYVEVPAEIKHKYAFKSWLENLLVH